MGLEGGESLKPFLTRNDQPRTGMNYIHFILYKRTLFLFLKVFCRVGYLFVIQYHDYIPSRATFSNM